MGKKKIKLEGVTLLATCALWGDVEKKATEHHKKFIRALDVCKEYCEFEDIKVLSDRPIKGCKTTHIPKIKNRQELSKFMIKEYYKHVDKGTHMLTVQADGFVLNPDAWTNDYLKYDWVSAPSPWEEYSCVNGGFALRSVELMKHVATHKHDWYHPEDFVITIERKEELEEAGFKFAPRELAEKFSREKNARYNEAWEGEFGFHDITKTDISKWKAPDFFRLDWEEWTQQMQAPNKKQHPYPPVREAHVYD